MKNKVQEGKALTFVAPYALSSGDGFLVGRTFAVATDAAISGDTVVGERTGLFTLTKAASQAWTAYATAVFWDNTNKCATSVQSGNTFIGVATLDATSSATGILGNVLLLPNFCPVKSAVIADPTGGTTIDAEARTAIASIIDALQAAGIVAAA
jgi:predicted RecA/RadA family phage recombinase